MTRLANDYMIWKCQLRDQHGYLTEYTCNILSNITQFDSSVLGTDDDTFKQTSRTGAGDSLKPIITNAAMGQGMAGYTDPSSVPASDSPALSSHGQHHHSSHSHGQYVPKSSTSSPHVDRAERGEGDGSREHRHKKKVRALLLRSFHLSFWWQPWQLTRHVLFYSS